MFLDRLRRVAGMQAIDIWGWLGKVTLRLNQASLKVDDVITELEVLGLDGFEIVVQNVVVANLLLQLFDVTFLALSESPL